MNGLEPRCDTRRGVAFLVPLMLVCNTFLLLCVLGLGLIALGGGGRLRLVPRGGDENQQIVEDYLAARVPGYRYRVREWFPATPLSEVPSSVGDVPSEFAPHVGYAQRVRIEFYGPHGARHLDTVYWIQNGKVTRVMSPGSSRFAERL